MNIFLYVSRSKLSLHLLVILVLFSITSCATFSPQTLTCSSIDTSGNYDYYANSDGRFEKQMFSILPPSGENWCMSTNEPRQVGFTTRNFIGKYFEKEPPLEDQAYMQMVAARTLKVKDVDISNPVAVKKFIKKWLSVGFPETVIGDQSYAELSPTELSKRFDLVESNVEIDNTYDADCARFESSYVEKEGPSYPWIRDFDFSGTACRHPDASKTIVFVQYAEFRRQGYKNPEFSKRAKLEAERTLRSLQFVKTQ